MDPQDVMINPSPTDGVSSIDFSPKANFIAVASWNGQIGVYVIDPSGGSSLQAGYVHNAPALCAKWSTDGTQIVSGGADNAGRIYDINTGQSRQIAEHAAPIKAISYLDQNIVVTGSWDKTIKYWDLRTPSPVGSINLNERVYAMDHRNQILVAGTADRVISVVDLSNPTVVFQQETSPLKHQIRQIKCFTVGRGFAVSSIEGRIGIQYIDQREKNKNFSFKCHRDESAKTIYSVNDVSFHPVHGTFTTAGSDGFINVWDKDRRQRLKAFSKVDGTVSCTAINNDGSILAYAVSYDWSKGYKFANDQYKIYIHAIKSEFKPPSNKR